MDMITAKQAAEKWGLTPRRVQGLCKEGKIPGAAQWGRTWMIPAETEYVKGGEISKQAKKKLIPRKSPSLMMTDLYNTPGTADEVIESLRDNPEAAAIFAAEIAYNRLEFDDLNEYAKILMGKPYEFYTTVAAGMQLAICAAYDGNIKLLKEARKYIFEAPCENDNDRDVVNFWLSVVDFMLGDVELPEWFQKGRFDFVTSDNYPAVMFQYVKFLWVRAKRMVLSKNPNEKTEGRILLKTLPNLMEPMISQAMVDRTLIAEISLRMFCAITYHDLGQKEDAIYHLDKAIALALPDRLFTIFVECRAQLDTLLDERLEVISPEALRTVKAYSKRMKQAQRMLHQDMAIQKGYDLSVREREAAKLAAFGMSNKAIAKRMNISESSVRTLISMALNKTGAANRKELGKYL